MMNFSEMPASRKMDLRIAREVFGLTVMKCDGEIRAFRETGRSRPPNFFEGIQQPFLHYSTDIAAAWEIVESFRFGWNGHAAACMWIEMYDICYQGNDYCVSIASPDIPKVSAWADAAPLAICRAALMVVEQCKEKVGQSGHRVSWPDGQDATAYASGLSAAKDYT